MMVQQITDETFAQEVLENPGLVLVDFYADWCGPCRVLVPILEEIAEQFSNHLKVCKINIDQSPKIPVQYDVMSVPTLLLFKGGTQCAVSVGAQSKSKLIDWMTPHLPT
ncbi:MAG: thioredoxin [Holosporales bacterium]|jgi:thioredoxin 1|nr:thioredoxin [Holosporales bacterium]